jgi:hypothetical protein
MKRSERHTISREGWRDVKSVIAAKDCVQEEETLLSPSSTLRDVVAACKLEHLWLNMERWTVCAGVDAQSRLVSSTSFIKRGHSVSTGEL